MGEAVFPIGAAFAEALLRQSYFVTLNSPQGMKLTSLPVFPNLTSLQSSQLAIGVKPPGNELGILIAHQAHHLMIAKGVNPHQ